MKRPRSGDFRLVPHGDQVEITYHLARPTFRVPDVVARSLFRRAVGSLLAEVEAEILRRAEGSPRGAGAPGAEALEARQ